MDEPGKSADTEDDTHPSKGRGEGGESKILYPSRRLFHGRSEMDYWVED